VVVAHAGRVNMTHITPDLVRMAEEGRQVSPRFDRLKVKLILRREKKAPSSMAALSASIEELLPVLNESRVSLALENLPSLEAVPSEPEMESLFEHFRTPALGYWHDTGHAVLRQRLGFAGQRQTLVRLGPRLLGMHVHGVTGFADDHVMPPRGELDMDMLAPFAKGCIPIVLEPAPGTPPEEIAAAAALLRSRWNSQEAPS
jgi:sugar phosphate isomerase/epimerase